jgi:hypothetical protein
VKKWLFLVAIILMAEVCLYSQNGERVSISGTVVDAHTKTPVAGCYVYLSGYSRSVTTDKNGYFKLSGIPGGVYELVLSHISYQKQVEVLELNQKSVVLEVRLGQSTTTLETVYVTDAKDLSQRRQQLKKFKEFFFGKEYRENRIRIENEADIELSKPSAGIVQSAGGYMLHIDNDYLGYKIDYYLKDLLLSKPTNMVLGFPTFTAKETNNPAEALYWTENRQRVYNGSVRHFFKALISRQLEEEGFEVFLTRNDPEKETEDFYTEAESRKLWLDDEKLPFNFTIEDTGTPNIKRINFGEILDVSYNKEFVRNGGYQNSKIKLLKDYVYVYENGVIVNPSAIKLFGQWSEEGMYHMLPSDYVSNDTLVLKDNLEQINLLSQAKRLVDEKPVEKVYIHSQSNDFFPGETIWYKAYVTAGPHHQPSPLSQNVYVELLKENTIVKRHILLANSGLAFGSMELPELMEPGRYTLRAYTAWMRNGPQDYFFRKLINIHHEEPILESAPPEETEEAGLDLQFFPEGGQLIPKARQILAFKAVDKKGQPVEVSGILESSEGNKIPFKSLHDGMGTIEVTPEINTTYNVQLKERRRSIALPLKVAQGYALTVDSFSSTESTHLTIQASRIIPEERLFLIAHVRGRVSYTLQFDMEQGKKTLLVPKSLLGSGIVQFTIFNEQGMPLAERLVFNQLENGSLNIDISTRESDVSTRAKTELTVKVTDHTGKPVSGSFSLAAMHASGYSDAAQSQHIDSYLLLSADLKGKIHDPEYYFDESNPERLEHLDLVMRTHGWRRFTWEGIGQKLEEPASFEFEKGIDITGRLVVQGRKKGVKNGTVTFISNNSEDALTKVTLTDKNGYFKLEEVNPSDEEDVLLRGINPKGSKKVSFEIDSVDRSAPVNLELEKRFAEAHQYESGFDPAGFNGYQSNAALARANEILNTDEQPDDTGLPVAKKSIYGTPSYSVKIEDLTNGNQGGNIFQYLNGRIPGLRMTPSGPVLRGTNAAPLTGDQDTTGFAGGNNGSLPLIYMDNNLTNMQTVSAIPVEAMERLEILKGPDAFVLGMGAQSGALMFFTKTGAELPEVLENGIFRININGYHIAREFYVPAYDEPLSFAEDLRKTIFWEPKITTDKNGIATISYFNSDIPGEVIVSMEGLSFNGIPGHAQYRYKVNIKE